MLQDPFLTLLWAEINAWQGLVKTQAEAAEAGEMAPSLPVGGLWPFMRGTLTELLSTNRIALNAFVIDFSGDM
jgi:hypothetical protein